MKLGWAYGRVLSRSGTGPVLIGKDTRISGYMFESALEAGLSAAGVDIRLLGPMPTPAIAYLTRNTRASGGIVISASHNLYFDNGIKFFTAEGTKLPDAMELEIERELEQPLACVPSRRLGKATRMNDAPRRYIEFCKSRITPDTGFKGMNLVIDCAHGAAYHIAPRVFEELGANILTIGARPDGLNINADCGATRPEMLRQMVLEHQYDLGIALDGDGDRLILVDGRGVVVDGDEILYIIARNRHATLREGIVGTLMSNFGVEQAIRALGLEFFRSRVGDRYVLEMLLDKGLILGGESSGHIINLDLTSTGDGIITALQVLEIIAVSGRSLHELKQGMNKYPQLLMNVHLQTGVNLDDYPELAGAAHAAEQSLAGNGRVLIRPSGTEPLVRVMVEGEDAVQVEAITRELVQRVRQILGDRVSK
jgi:phosphoglucosamine mutase